MTAPRLLVPLSFALISACAQQPTQPVELDAESECPTRLQVGQVLTLTLPSNPSTGYRWRVEKPAANVLRSLGPEVYSAPEEEDLVGNAGVLGSLSPLGRRDCACRCWPRWWPAHSCSATITVCISDLDRQCASRSFVFVMRRVSQVGESPSARRWAALSG